MGFIRDPEADNFSSSFGERNEAIGDDIRKGANGAGHNRNQVMARQRMANHLGANGKHYRDWHRLLTNSSFNLSMTGVDSDFHADRVKDTGDHVAGLATKAGIGAAIVALFAANDDWPEARAVNE